MFFIKLYILGVIIALILHVSMLTYEAIKTKKLEITKYELLIVFTDILFSWISVFISIKRIPIFMKYMNDRYSNIKKGQ